MHASILVVSIFLVCVVLMLQPGSSLPSKLKWKCTEPYILNIAACNRHNTYFRGWAYFWEITVHAHYWIASKNLSCMSSSQQSHCKCTQLGLHCVRGGCTFERSITSPKNTTYSQYHDLLGFVHLTPVCPQTIMQLKDAFWSEKAGAINKIYHNIHNDWVGLG